jgi:hypothetical protein
VDVSASGEVVASARRFLLLEARLLERRWAEAKFDGADALAVRIALDAYRNPDGGFGHGLEPDKLCPSSQPLDTAFALEVLVDVGCTEELLLAPLCDFLAGVSGPSGLVPILTAEAELYPRARHWSQIDVEPAFNPTAGIAGALHALDVQNSWLDDATATCLELIERDAFPHSAHAILNAARLLEQMPEHPLALAFRRSLRTMLDDAPDWRNDPTSGSYGLTPMHYAPTPNSFWADCFHPAEVASHLDQMVMEQQGDGGWPLSWEAVSAAQTLAWRGFETVHALSVLTAYEVVPPFAGD